MKQLFAVIAVLFCAYSSYALAPISGITNVCVGSTSHLYDVDSSGSLSWSSSNTAVATVGSLSGNVTGISIGTAIITYTEGGSSVTVVFTVNGPVPAPVTGLTTVCPSADITLADATSGGVWGTAATSVATVGTLTGVVTGVSGGETQIYYILGFCSAVVNITVDTFTAGTVFGPSSVCLGSTATLADTTASGGVWSSSNTAVATVSSGVVTGVSSGTAAISYSVTTSCGTVSSYKVITVSTTSTAGTISGYPTVRLDHTTGLWDGITGGLWTSSNTAVATVGSSSGVVTGISMGSAIITYTVLGCSGSVYTTFIVNVSSFGPLSGCTGTTSYFSDSITLGTWSSSNTAVATIGTSGVVSSLTVGTTTISYTVGGVSYTAPFTVYAMPAAISGVSNICVGASAIFTDATTGGTWSSDDPYIATVGSTTGSVTGVNDGTVDVSYTTGGECYVSFAVLVGPLSPGWISGDSTMCSGSSFTLTDAVTGGTWSSSNTAIATVGLSTGVVTGVSAGTAYISYTFTSTCGSSTTSQWVSVSSTTAVGTISTSPTVYLTIPSGASDPISGGTWSSSNTAVATVNATTGLITGVSLGTATIYYTVSGCGGIASASTVITVVPLNSISGEVLFSGGFGGPVMVWLITYNSGTSELEAADSMYVYCSGDSVFYQFLGEPTDSYRIKAAVNLDTTIVITGYIPTYHTSNFYWHDATVLHHTAGTADSMQDINMAYGSVAAGAGFVSGNVTLGANRGTSGSAPAVGLLMVLETSAGVTIQQTQTDASGNYSFSDIPLGSYTIHPELINYLSYDYTGVTLTSGAASVTATDFIQHTKSHTITPVTNAVAVINPTLSSAEAYPNPTNGRLYLKWQEASAETGTITVNDITGREIYKNEIDMPQGAGQTQIDLSDLSGGLYIVSVKSGNINYINKVQVK